jgi:hypothetical protein
MRDLCATHHATEDRAQPRVGKHVLCEDDESVMHIVFGYGSGDAVQISLVNYAIGPQPGSLALECNLYQESAQTSFLSKVLHI